MMDGGGEEVEDEQGCCGWEVEDDMLDVMEEAGSVYHVNNGEASQSPYRETRDVYIDWVWFGTRYGSLWLTIERITREVT